MPNEVQLTLRLDMHGISKKNDLVCNPPDDAWGGVQHSSILDQRISLEEQERLASRLVSPDGCHMQSSILFSVNSVMIGISMK